MHILEFLDIDYKIKNLEFAGQGSAMGGAQLVLRNIENRKCVATGGFKSGIYRIKDKKTLFVRGGYSIDDIKDENEFVVLAVSKNSIVVSESECAKIRTKGSLLDAEYKLKDWAVIAAKEIYVNLKLA